MVLMSDEIGQLRNIGIIAHIDAGKTTLTERMLFLSGFTHRVGAVDKGTTVTDYDPEEQERGITINSACVTFPWAGAQVNLIDTPGHVDFTAEVERSLRVLDGGVVVFSAREGVEAQSETVWRQADKYRVPRIALINKMDREGADFYETLDEIRTRLGCTPVVMNLPLGVGPPHFRDPFRGVIDLVNMRLMTFSADKFGAEVTLSDIPAEVRDDAEMWRAQLLDHVSLFSDELTERMLAEEPIGDELLHAAVRAGTVRNRIVPVFCGSALDGIGVQPVLDAVVRYLPSPLDIPPVEGVDPTKRDAKATRRPSADEPFCALLFKIQADRHGDLHYVRVYSGRLRANSRVYNPAKDKKENVPQLWRIQADRREQVESVAAGDIVGIVGLRHSITGDTLCDPKAPIVLESIRFPETVVSMAIEPESSVERKKLAVALDMLRRQDPTFRAEESDETGQTLISGMGELHLEVIKHRLLREHKLNVKVHKPRVSYRETIARAVEVSGACHRVLAGQTTFAELTLRMEPCPAQSKPLVVCRVAPDELPGNLLNAAMETIEELSVGGGSLGFPLLHVKTALLCGRFREGESNEAAFRVAAADAFNRGLREAGIVLLEPIMRLEVTLPEEYLGDVVGDLQQRRATIVRTHHRGKLTVLEAHAPLAALFGYTSAMRSLTQGRGTCTMEPHSYGPAPQEVLESFL